MSDRQHFNQKKNHTKSSSQSRWIYMDFNKTRIPLLVKSSQSPEIKISYKQYNTAPNRIPTKCTCNKTNKSKTHNPRPWTVTRDTRQDSTSLAETQTSPNEGSKGKIKQNKRRSYFSFHIQIGQLTSTFSPVDTRT